MAERKFDYNNVSTVYQNMKKITGDAGDGESIAGILHKIDEEVHNKVDVSEEAIFGDLGKQMLLDWDNTSANFDNFVTNFSNWSTLIAQSAGNYAQFEQDIAGFRQENPLGVTSGGITDAYTNTGFYRQYTNDNIDAYNNSLSSLKALNNVDLSNIEYAVTDSQALLSRHKVVAGLMLFGDVASVALIAAAIAAPAASSSTALATTPNTTLSTTSGAVCTPGGTPLLGGGKAMTLEQAAAKCAGNSNALKFLDLAKQHGATKLVTNNSADVLQLLDSSGKVLYTFTPASTVASSTAATTASAATSSAASASASSGLFSSVAQHAKSGFSTLKNAAGKFGHGVANTATNFGQSVANKAGSAFNTAKTATGTFVKNHPVASSVGASVAVSGVLDSITDE